MNARGGLSAGSGGNQPCKEGNERKTESVGFSCPFQPIFRTIFGSTGGNGFITSFLIQVRSLSHIQRGEMPCKSADLKIWFFPLPGGLVSQAIVLPTSIEDVELYGPVLGHIGFDNVYISDILSVITLIANRKLQHHIMDMSDRQYVITSVHDHSFCGRLLQQNANSREGGVVIIRATHATLIASFDAPAQPWMVFPHVEEFFKDISTL